MDRLLTVNEIYETESEWLFEWGKVPAQYKLDLLKAQDAKTAHLVAQEIFKELEERCPHTPDDAFDWIKRMCPGCFHAIKSKWGIE